MIPDGIDNTFYRLKVFTTKWLILLFFAVVYATKEPGYITKIKPIRFIKTF